MPAGASLQFGMAAWSNPITYTDLVISSVLGGVQRTCEAGYYCTSGAFNTRGATDGTGV